MTLGAPLAGERRALAQAMPLARRSFGDISTPTFEVVCAGHFRCRVAGGRANDVSTSPWGQRMTETVSNSSDELPPAAPGRLPDDRLHAALKSVIAIANDVAEPDDVAQEVVDRLVAHLELGQARIYLLTSEGDSGGHTHLELAAAAGSHAAITRDMPSVALDAETDIARVADSGDLFADVLAEDGPPIPRVESGS